MSKIFRYTKITGHYYCPHSEDWEKDGVEFDYEVEDEKLLPTVIDLLCADYADKQSEEFESILKVTLERMIIEKNMLGLLCDNYETQLKDIFEKEALEFYED